MSIATVFPKLTYFQILNLKLYMEVLKESTIQLFQQREFKIRIYQQVVRRAENG
jgi:hypothetical protein